MSKVIPVNDADVPVGKHSNISAVKDDVESQNKKENQSAIDIAKQHKIKVIVGVLAVIGIVVGVVLGLLLKSSKGKAEVKAAVSNRVIIPAAKQKSASKATKVQTASVLPSKSSKSNRRLFDDGFDSAVKGLDHLRKLAKSPSTFDSTSDYNLFPDPEYIVGI